MFINNVWAFLDNNVNNVRVDRAAVCIVGIFCVGIQLCAFMQSHAAPFKYQA
jgi:hypothetical protein